MRWININQFKNKVIFLLISVVIFITFILGFSQYFLLAKNYEIQDQQRNVLLKDYVMRVVSATDYMQKLIELPIEKESQVILQNIIDDYMLNGISKVNLNNYYDESNSLDLYVIDQTNTIIDATYITDIGLDLSQFTGVGDYLQKVRENGVFSTDRLSLSSIENIMTKYCYLPTPDGKYIFETSKRIKREEAIPNSLSFDNFGNEISNTQDFVVRVLLYNNYGIAFQDNVEEPIKINDEYYKYYEQALTTMKQVNFNGEFEGKPVKYNYIPYAVYNADKIHEKTVIELITSKEDIKNAKNMSLFLMMLIILLGSGLAIVYAITKSRTLLSPLSILSEGITKVSNGDFDSSIQIDTGDEFAKIGTYFNAMTKQVKELMLIQREKEDEIMIQKEEIEALYEETTAMNDSLLNMIENNKTGYFETIKALANAEEEKDAYTRGHCERVMSYALQIGEAINLTPDELETIRFGAILHDIGKIGVPEHILNKETKLSFEEFELIKQHPSVGERILRDLTFMKESKRIVYEHHEWYNGQGYPRQIKAEEINKLARIVCIADAFDAMTSQRPYRKHALTKEQAIYELEIKSGTQFDPDFVSVFVELLNKNDN